MLKFNKWLSTLLRNKEKLEEIAITTVNAECFAIILNKVPEKLEDPGKFLIQCALQELDRTNALADSGASINLLPHSIYMQIGLGALKPTRMTLELANHSVTHPMGIAEDVVVRVDGFTFLADFVVNKQFAHAISVIDFSKAIRIMAILSIEFSKDKPLVAVPHPVPPTPISFVGDELVFYAEKSEKSKNKQFAHAISVIDFSKDEPFSGSSTNHSDALPPSSSPVKTSDNLEEFADELTLLKKGVHEENFQVYSNPLFEFNDNFNSSKVECSDPEDIIDEIDAFLAMEVSSNFEEGYFDSKGDVIFLESMLSDDTTHNLAPEVIVDHEPKQNESIHNSSITFSSRSDPLHHEFAGELLTLPSRIVREHEEYLSLITILPEHESPNNPSVPRPPPEPPDVKIHLEPDTAVINNFDVLNKEACFNLEEGVQIFLPFFTYPEDSPFILSLRSEDLVFDPDIFNFHFSYLEPMVFSMEVSYSKYCSP
ncbi:reverse transcriptase domain-containing protein [Tanacetum coccineum]